MLDENVYWKVGQINVMVTNVKARLQHWLIPSKISILSLVILKPSLRLFTAHSYICMYKRFSRMISFKNR